MTRKYRSAIALCATCPLMVCSYQLLCVCGNQLLHVSGVNAQSLLMEEGKERERVNG